MSSLSYDPFTQMTQQITTNGNEQIGFRYGGANQRVMKTFDYQSNTSSTLYLHGQNEYPLMEKTKAGAAPESRVIYIYGPTGLLAMQKEGEVYYVSKDHLGSTRVVVDETATVAAYFDYAPFGSLMHSGVNTDIAYRFTGQEFDSESGLHNFRARLYDDELFRFYAMDPAGQFASPFAYVGNNPLIYNDPDGQFINFALIGYYAWQAYKYYNYAQMAYGIIRSAMQGGISGFVQSSIGFGTGMVAQGLAGNYIPGNGVLSKVGSGAIGGAASGAIGSQMANQSVSQGAIHGFQSGALHAAIGTAFELLGTFETKNLQANDAGSQGEGKANVPAGYKEQALSLLREADPEQYQRLVDNDVAVLETKSGGLGHFGTTIAPWHAGKKGWLHTFLYGRDAIFLNGRNIFDPNYRFHNGTLTADYYNSHVPGLVGDRINIAVAVIYHESLHAVGWGNRQPSYFEHELTIHLPLDERVGTYTKVWLNHTYMWYLRTRF